MPRRQGDYRTWRRVFGFTFVAAVAWILATPLMTGPDEVAQARRAAAVARGQIQGERIGTGPPLVLEVSVPELYGEPGDQQWRCFLGPLVPGTPQEPMTLAPADCPELPRGDTLVEVPTVQYRGQPFFYALSGLPTLVSTGPAGAYGMRLVGALVASALVASTAVTVRRAPWPPLAGLALLGALTPAVVYLAASTNPSAVEITAALCAWAAGTALATSAASDDRRLIARFGASLTVLVLTRGLSPVFAGVIGGTCFFLAGWPRVRFLLARRDVRIWGAVLAFAAALSVGWLAQLGRTHPLPDRPGSGWTTALGYLPWYLRQAVGVFGTNDSALTPTVTALWVAAWIVIVAAALWALIRRDSRRARRPVLVTLGCIVGGLAMQVSAEGLSLPPIGFFWQGRYALPLLFGALIVASVSGPPQPTGPTRHRASTHRAAVAAGATGFVAVHCWAFVVVARHHGGGGQGSVGISDALLRPGWNPPLPLWLLALALLVSLSGLAAILLRDERPPRPAPSLGSPSLPAEPVTPLPAP